MYKWNKAVTELKNGNNKIIHVSKCGKVRIWKWEGDRYQVELWTCWREDGIESWDFIPENNENEGFDTLHEAKIYALLSGVAPLAKIFAS